MMTDTKPKGKTTSNPLPPGPAPAPERIWCYDLRTGWHHADDPLPADYDDFEAALEAAGFEAFAKLGDDCGTLALSVYVNQTTGQFHFSLDTFGQWQPFLAADLPSALDLLARLAPMVRAVAELDVIAEAREERERSRRRGPDVYDSVRRVMRYAGRDE